MPPFNGYTAVPGIGVPPTNQGGYGGGGGQSWYSNPQTWMAIAGLANAGASIYGAYNQNQIQGANFAAQQMHQQQLLDMINQNMMQGQNPYAAQLQGLMGQMRPPGFAPQGQQPGGQPGQGQFGGGRPPFGPGMGAYWDNNGIMQQAPVQGAPAAPVNMQGPVPAFASAGGLQGPRPGQIIDETFGGGQIGAGPGGQTGGPQLWQYQNQTPFTYNPTQLGNAPQVNAPNIANPQFGQFQQSQGINIAQPNLISLEQLTAPQLGAAPDFTAASAESPGAVTAPKPVNASMVTGTQGSNAGQDALLQMMRRDIGGSPDQYLRSQLQQIGSGDTQFDNSALFASMAPSDQNMLDEQVSQLKGSKGSFSKLFSSNTEKEERKLRENFAQGVQQRNLGIQQQSFENAQNRRQGALGTMAGLEQFYGQMPLQNAAMQLQAAQAAGQLGQGAAGLDLQAQMANQQAGLGAGQFNANLQMQAAMGNQQAQLALNQMNAQMQQQAGMFNAGNQQQLNLAQGQMGLQAGMQNQQLGLQANQFNTGNQFQANQMNAQLGMQNNQFNAGQFNQNNQFQNNLLAQIAQANAGNQLQAGLANQSLTGQYGLANQAAMNQGGQFNAGMQQQAFSNNTQQGNIYNQMLMQMMGQANQAQMAQQGMNNQLIGMYAGVGVPQQLPSAWPGAISDVASTAMMYPFLNQMMGGWR